jgi:hypothetical protein
MKKEKQSEINMAGRKSKLSDQVKEKVTKAVSAGNFLVTASEYAGVSVSTISNWMQRGEDAAERRDGGKRVPKSERKYLDFFIAIRTARNEVEARNVVTVSRQATNDWRAAAWFLERSFPQRWGKKTAMELSGVDGGPIQTVSWVDALREADAE